MAQSLGLPIDVCRGLGISPLRINILLSRSQADRGPRSVQVFFFGVLERLKLFWNILLLIPSGTEIVWRISLKLHLLSARSRFHCHLQTNNHNHEKRAAPRIIYLCHQNKLCDDGRDYRNSSPRQYLKYVV